MALALCKYRRAMPGASLEPAGLAAVETQLRGEANLLFGFLSQVRPLGLLMLLLILILMQQYQAPVDLLHKLLLLLLLLLLRLCTRCPLVQRPPALPPLRHMRSCQIKSAVPRWTSGWRPEAFTTTSGFTDTGGPSCRWCCFFP
jgi:hypothetical protein